MATITPIILCGGSGTRLWPLSRKSYPKQFAPLLSEASLLTETARRYDGEEFAAPIVITASDFRFMVVEEMAKAEMVPAAILIEPEPRNTAPAVIAATLEALAHDPEALILIAPSDHAIPDAAGFRQAILSGVEAARDGDIVTCGIKPTSAETGYGWLDCGPTLPSGARRLNRFVEKPDAALAERLVAAGNLWNAGVFLARADVMRAAFATHAPGILRTVETAWTAARRDLQFKRLDPAAWSEVDSVSIDYAIMEKAANLAAISFDGRWSDLGSWTAVWEEMERDADGNAVSTDALAIGCEGSLLRSDSPNLQVVGIGLKQHAVIALHDAVLVADLTDSQRVREAVTALKARDVPQAEVYPVDYRPWGWFESLVIGPRFQVKRIHVHPGAALSLQSHRHRSEHWVVVEGEARVTIDDTVATLSEDQSVYIPLGAVHRLENPGTGPLVLIEIQSGAYLGEDDITRFEDDYARG